MRPVDNKAKLQKFTVIAWL